MNLAHYQACITRQEAFLKHHPHGILLLPTAPKTYRNHDVAHPYRQCSNFYYMTGCVAEKGIFALLRNPHAERVAILFLAAKDPEQELWNGYQIDPIEALTTMPVTHTYPVEAFPSVLLDSIDPRHYLVTPSHQNPLWDKTITSLLHMVQEHQRTGFLTVVDPRTTLGHLRLKKDLYELDNLRKACEISAEAHNAALRMATIGMMEYEIAAFIEYECKKKGAQRMGYPSIVATGSNALCLHYTTYQTPIASGDLLLIDAGAEWNYYTADITRTFPVQGIFTQAQKDIYTIVKNAQSACIQAVKPGITLADIHKIACTYLTEGLLSLGILKNNLSTALEEKTYRCFYPHGTSHWLGSDVHDPYPTHNITLEPGMVFTIEPGLYLKNLDHHAIDHKVLKNYHNIGVRIEDNILVTQNGYENLTEKAIKW